MISLYNVEVGVQNLRDAKDRIESGFTIMFYSTEVVVSKLIANHW